MRTQQSVNPLEFKIGQTQKMVHVTHSKKEAGDNFYSLMQLLDTLFKLNNHCVRFFSLPPNRDKQNLYAVPAENPNLFVRLQKDTLNPNLETHIVLNYPQMYSSFLPIQKMPKYFVMFSEKRPCEYSKTHEEYHLYRVEFSTKKDALSAQKHLREMYVWLQGDELPMDGREDAEIEEIVQFDQDKNRFYMLTDGHGQLKLQVAQQFYGNALPYDELCRIESESQKVLYELLQWIAKHPDHKQDALHHFISQRIESLAFPHRTKLQQINDKINSVIALMGNEDTFYKALSDFNLKEKLAALSQPASVSTASNAPISNSTTSLAQHPSVTFQPAPSSPEKNPETTFQPKNT